jgi:hypothetical protein
MNILRYAFLPIAGFFAGWLFSMQDASPAPLAEASLPSANARIDSLDTPLAPDPSDQSVPVQRAVIPVTLVSLREAAAYPSEMHRLGALGRLLDTITPAQFPALYAGLAVLDSEDSEDRVIIDFLCRRWAQVAPKAAVDASLANSRIGFYSAICAWGEQDALAALARIENLHFNHIAHLRERLASLGLPKPGQVPPAEALRQIRERLDAAGPGMSLDNATGQIFAEWARNDPTAAWQAALMYPNGENEGPWMRQLAINNVIHSCVSTDPKAVLPLIEAMPAGQERSDAQRAYIVSLVNASHEPIARNYALALPDGPDRRRALAAFAGGISNLNGNTKAAGAFLAGLTPADWQDPTLFGETIQSWMGQQPKEASDVLLAHLPPAAQLTKQDVAAYAEMFRSVDARGDYGGAGDIVVKLPDAIRSLALAGVLDHWCYTDSAAAGKWAVALPVGTARDQALEQIAVAWTRRGAGEVTRWLDTLPADSGRDAAVEGFARTVMSVSPGDALAWLRTVPDEADRLARLRRIWQSWTDRETAQRWLNASTDLTAAERAALQK